MKPLSLSRTLCALVLCTLFSTLSYAQPANNLCANAITITSAAGACNSTSGSLLGATYTTITPNPACGNGFVDVWYRFTAQSTNPTITITGSTTAQIGVYTLASCGGVVTAVSCATAQTLSLTGLTVSANYLIRVNHNSGTAPTIGNAFFNICVSDPPPNDLCAAATVITPGTCARANSSLYGATNTAMTNGTCTGNNTLRDVWFSYTAGVNGNHTFYIDGAPANTNFQVYSGGACPGTTSPMASGCVGSNTVTLSLTIATVYRVRVYNTSSTPGNFTLFIRPSTPAAPANDYFAQAVAGTALNVTNACSNTAGTMYSACAGTAPVIYGSCAGTVNYDVWYKFVAPSEIATVTISSVGAQISSYGVEILSGDNTGLYALVCGTNSATATGLIAGTTYYVRVYSGGSYPASSTFANSGFNICVTSPPPVNDECSGAIDLYANTTCLKAYYGTVNIATLSSGFGTSDNCDGAATPTQDVWFKFTATQTTATITVADFGSAFAATRYAALYSGTCGSLVPHASGGCGTPTINATGLTIGNVYYIRVYKSAALVQGDGRFSICVTAGSASSSNLRTGNSYVNITKNATGGVVEPGDILEIRFTVYVTSGTIYSARYVDNLPTITGSNPMSTTMQVGAAGSANAFRIITNEGLTYRSYSSTDNVNDDAGTYKSAPGGSEFNIKMNLGSNPASLPTAPTNNTSTHTGGSQHLTNTHRPTLWNSSLQFATAYRVQVPLSASVGDTINLYGGRLIYKNSSGGADEPAIAGNAYRILISAPATLCPNSVGINTAIEDGGTFGEGTSINRNTGLEYNIPGYAFVASTHSSHVGDGQYSIVNNTSPRGGTNDAAYTVNNYVNPCASDMDKSNRMHGGHWYIDGDHTGTTNAAGNAPTAPGTTGGYMLMVNADYVASEAFRQELQDLCANTYYEFSAWFKNICPTCGVDSTAAQFAGTVTAPHAGYPGVLPNLTFAINGIDYYSTGEITLGGENGGWVKRGFTFLTGMSPTNNFTLTIRNNAQGGGGNDWVMDDVTITSCYPTMTYSPSSTPNICEGGVLQIADTVRSFFSNYTEFKWQRSTDGGTNWTDIAGTAGSITPTWNGTQYEFISTYTIPPAWTTAANDGDMYRLVVAALPFNLDDPTCAYSDPTEIELNVLTNCAPPLDVSFLSVNGTLSGNHAVIRWVTSREDEAVQYLVERSDDGRTFTEVARINGNFNIAYETNSYAFTDPLAVTGSAFYRVVILSVSNNSKKYSRTLRLDAAATLFGFGTVINPFRNDLKYDIISPADGIINTELINMNGKRVKLYSERVYPGTNQLTLSSLENLPAGVYMLKVTMNGSTITKTVVKH